MAAPMKTGMPEALDLTGAFVVQFTALSPTDGSVVAGVTVSNASLLVENVQGGSLDDSATFGDPLWISIPVDDTSS